jgi:hypothetical protein
MDQDSGGKPHIHVGDPPDPDARVSEVYVLVAVQPDGGEGIYGHKIGDNMFNFVTAELMLKDLLEKFLREQGTVEVCRRDGLKLEWRTFTLTGEPEEIT